MKYNGAAIPAELEYALVQMLQKPPHRLIHNENVSDAVDINQGSWGIVEILILTTSLLAAGILLHSYYVTFGIMR